MKSLKNTMVFGMLMGLAAYAVPSLAAGNGAAAVRMATQVLGSSLQGQASNGQACELRFSSTPGALLLGVPVIGTYTLSVGGSEAGFYFIAETEAAGSSTDMSFETSQHEDSDNSPDEGGFHRGFTTKMDLDVSIRGNTMLVRIVNGTSTVCRFNR